MRRIGLIGIAWTVALLGCAPARQAAPRLERVPSRVSARPAWTTQTRPGYFVGLSRPADTEADARDQALADARRQIVEYLGIRLETELLDQVLEKQTGGLTQLDERTEVKVETASRAAVQARAEAWHVEESPDGAYLAWCSVPFSEERHRTFVQEMVEATLAVSGDVYGKGQQYQAHGDLAQALDAYTDALEALEELKDWTSDRDLLTESDRLRADVRGKAKDLLGRLSLSVEQDGQTGRVGRALAAPLTVRIKWDQAGRLSPVPHLTVHFEWADGTGDLDAVANTDQTGVAQCNVRRIDEPGRHEVRAVVGDVRWERLIDVVLPRTTFHFSAFFPTALVHIQERLLSEPRAESTVGTQITQALRDAGFEVITPEGRPPAGEDAMVRWAKAQGADLLVFGTASADDVNRIREGFFVVTAAAQIHVRATATGKVVTTRDLVNGKQTDTRGFGNSEQAAAREAIQFRKTPDVWGELVRGIQQALVEE